MEKKIQPDYAEFCRLAKKGDIVPVYMEVIADLLTPVSAYINISHKSRYSFLLESVEGGERAARYSFLGVSPYSIFRSKGENYEIDGTTYRGDPLKAIDRIFRSFKVAGAESLPPFIGGGVGFFGYDIIRHIEKLPAGAFDDLGFPDISFMFTDTILIFDHLMHTIRIVCSARVGKGRPLREIYREAKAKIESLYGDLMSARFIKKEKPAAKKKSRPVRFSTNVTKDEFKKMVLAAKEYIRAGDIFQVVLSQRFSAKVDVPPFDLYRVLRSLNPSPYMFYLHLDDIVLVGASPEVLVTVRGRDITVRPIAGTRRRPADRTREDAVIADLLSDEKERAEHIMLVDLGRNDVGRVAEPGTVRVTDLMYIEKYSHVIHIVSNVVGKLRSGRNAVDVLRACFPAGTVSGAPKVRAMEIIEELEPTRRGPYAGAIGYLSYTGFFDTCITIRTIFMKDGVAHVQAGGGIVADSVPEREFQESLNKARALRLAIERASEGIL